MNFRYLDFERDLDSVSALMAEFDPEPLSPAEILNRWQTSDLAIDPLREVCEVDGRVAGYLTCRRLSFLPEGRCLLDLAVGSDFSRQRIGTQLFERGKDHALAKGWATIATRCREVAGDGPEKFLAGLGYRLSYVHNESVMDLAIEPIEIPESLQKLPEDIQILTWNDLGDTLENQRKLYELMIECDKDEPSAEEFGTMDFEAFCLEFFKKKGFLPGGMFIAVHEGDWIGLHNVEKNFAGDTDGNIGYTGVLPLYRGKGLAKALKWRGVQFGRAKGWKSVLTHNDSRNSSMLHINSQFGFVNRPGWKHFCREVQ